MLRNYYTVPARCRHRGGKVDPLSHATRSIGPPSRRSAIQSDTGSLGPKSSKTSQFAVINRFIGIWSHASESCYHSYTVATSGVNRIPSQICHNRLFRRKLQHNFLHMISTEVSSSATHNSSLLYLSNHTRPDILFAVGMLGRAIAAPSAQDVVSVKRLMRYLAVTRDYGLVIGGTGE
jgi:hypothetical protein